VQLSEEAVAWIGGNLRVSLSGELTELQLAGESRRRALAQTKSEAQKLLDLSLRRLIDDNTFAARHAELRDRQVKLEVELEQPRQTPDQLLSGSIPFCLLPEGARSLHFRHLGSTPANRRGALFEPEVRAKELLYKAKKPFSLLSNGTASSTWCTIVEDLRTWILDDSEDHWVPALTAESTRDIMTEDAYAA